MRGIKADLMERLQILRSERVALGDKLTEIDNYISHVEGLMALEGRFIPGGNGRHAERNPVRDFILTSFKTSRSWTLEALRDAADRKGIVSDGSLGRQIQGNLLSLLNIGLLTKEGDQWVSTKALAEYGD